MNRKILAIVLTLSMTAMLVTPLASGAGIPNLNTITWATIGGPDADWGTDPGGSYDTSSSSMQQQVLEPLFMYNDTSTNSFIAMLADTWPGYSVNPGHWITPSSPDPTAPLGTVETWYFHIRENVQWQNPAYGTVKPSDVAYSIQRGMLQDAGTGVQWLLYTPLTGAGPADSVDPMFDRNGNGVINSTEYANYLAPAIAGAVGYNDTTGMVWFNLPAPYAPFMQILTQSWAFVLNKQWCIERGCWNGQLGNYTEFQRTWKPTASPLMDSAVISSAEPMMGTGPYKLVNFNSDPHTGFQAFQKFDSYWQGWPAGFATYATIKVVEEWANRKAQFFSTDPGLQVDFADVPGANVGELHVGGNKDAATLPGFRLTKYYPQVIGSLFFCYNVTSPSDFMPKIGVNDAPLLFSDRDLRLAFMYCLNVSAFLQDAFLGEAIQPTTVLAVGTAYYNASKPTYDINLAKATQLFQRAWGGQIWSQGMTVKLVYNSGNVARQTAMSMIADVIMTRIPWPVGVTVTITPTQESWSVILPAMEDHELPSFCIGWMADFPDPADWFVPFLDPSGTYSGISQVIEYGINATNMAEAWSSTASYGPPPYTNALGEYVTEINNTYVHHLNMVALGALSATREKLYNEMMDIYFAEGGGEALYQATNRHYERDWINGWVGKYSNNPIAVGHYFYQIWKATALTIYGVDMSAVGSISNTTYVYPLILDNLTGNMINYKTLTAVYVNYTLHVTYTNLTGPTIWVAIELLRTDIWTGNYYFPIILTKTLGPGQGYTVNVKWYEKTKMTNGIWKISLRTDAIGTAGGEVYDVNTANNVVDSPTKVKSIPYNETYTVGDLGGGVPPVFFAFDKNCDGKDLALFLQCYKGTAPSYATYLGDLGGGVPPNFFAFDKNCDGKDLALFLQCYKGTGP